MSVLTSEEVERSDLADETEGGKAGVLASQILILFFGLCHKHTCARVRVCVCGMRVCTQELEKKRGEWESVLWEMRSEEERKIGG